MAEKSLTRRMALMTGAAALATPSVLRAQEASFSTTARRNASSFKARNWRNHFKSLGSGAILADIDSKVLHYWGPGENNYHLFPSSVPRSEALTRRGYTRIVRKRIGPSWTPTASMRAADPSLPPFVEPGPGNPLGTHALYLSWPAYLIHGTHDTRKIGRQSSSGCIGLYNEHISALFAMAGVGTQVLLL